MDRRLFLQLMAGAWIAPQLPHVDGVYEADLRLMLYNDDLGMFGIPHYDTVPGQIITTVQYPKLVYQIGTGGITVPSFVSKGDWDTRNKDLSHLVVAAISGSVPADNITVVSESAEGWINLPDMNRHDERARMNPYTDLLGPINNAFAMIERYDICVEHIVVHPSRAHMFTDLNSKHHKNKPFDKACVKELVRAGNVGNLWTGMVKQSSACNPNEILLAAQPDYVGVIPIWHETHEEIKAGLAVLNDYSVAKIVFID